MGYRPFRIVTCLNSVSYVKALVDAFNQEKALVSRGLLRDCKHSNLASWRPDSWPAAHLWRVEVCGEGGPGLAVGRLAAGGVLVHHSAGTWAGAGLLGGVALLLVLEKVPSEGS